jgi:Na+-transporting NADH:ubiquinone oxidoreductase subunit B
VIGAVFLIFTGMASWRVIFGALAGLLGTVLLFNTIAPDNSMFSIPWYWHLVMGGFMFGTVFLATDPVAGATTNPGRWGFGLLVGVLTVLVRVTNPSFYEGVMFAILLASMFTPIIDFVVTERNIGRRVKRLQRASQRVNDG